MTDDFSIFWQNDERARALFYELYAKCDKNAYDEDYLTLLAAYEEAGGAAAHVELFAATYLLHHGDAENATRYGEQAYAQRPASHAVWSLLARAYRSCGRYADALVMQGYLSNCFNVPIELNLPPQMLTQETLDRLSLAMGKASYAPIALYRMHYAAGTGLTQSAAPFAFEFLPADVGSASPYYVGVHTEQDLHGAKAWLLAATRATKGFAEHVGADLEFDILRAHRVPGSVRLDLNAGQACVLPVIGTTEEVQELHIRTSAVDDTSWMNPGTPNFYRLEESATLSSTHGFIVGTPIRIGHSRSRRKLVLNILVDALPWHVLGTNFSAHMPRTARFFEKGLTFHQNFSTAEYTYPALAAIETGMYAHHSQIFNDRIAAQLAPQYITLSERMNTLGYHAVNLMGDGNGIYNGVTRGYDRLIVTPYRLPAYVGAERTIRHLDGLPDVDHFIFLHVTDLHPWPNNTFSATSSVQTRLPLAARLEGAAENVPSPYLRPTPLNQATFWQNVRNVDRALGTLFSYIEETYAEEDYLVNLYSDHGVPIFSATHYIVDAHLTHAAWMMRGAGVPAGTATYELTSTVDIYPALGHLLGFPVGDSVDGAVPKILGGTGRDITFSNSLYPTKPYFLAVRSAEHTLCLETKEKVAMDGTVDLGAAQIAIYSRAHEREAEYGVDSPEVRAFFYPRVRAFLQGIGSNGEQFPPPKEQ